MPVKWTGRGRLVAALGLLTIFGVLEPAAIPNPVAAPSSRLNVVALQVPTPPPNQFLTESEKLTAAIYDRVSPSVVSINVAVQLPDADVIMVSGSGFVIDEQGYIMTNHHVIDRATRIEVSFLDGTIVRADLLGTDPRADLAVLQVDLPADRLPPIEFADSDELRIGQVALAIGSPFGQRWTLNVGTISALDRAIPSPTGFLIGSIIQTDAPLNPGNSGGPLLNLRGQVVGVTSAAITPAGGSAGIGFAIPSNLVQRVARELIDNGFISYSYLGVAGSDVTLALLETLDLPSDFRGFVIDTVVPGGPAARAELQSASNPIRVDGLSIPTSVDIIMAIDGFPITGVNSLLTYLANNTAPGDVVTLTVLRAGEQIRVSVRLIPRP